MDPVALRGRTVVVIDVLRWTTVVVSALANGAAALEAFATPDEASHRAAALGRERVAALVVVASFRNSEAIQDELRRASPGGVTLLCAGRSGAEAVEDSACAGALAHQIVTAVPDSRRTTPRGTPSRSGAPTGVTRSGRLTPPPTPAS